MLLTNWGEPPISGDFLEITGWCLASKSMSSLGLQVNLTKITRMTITMIIVKLCKIDIYIYNDNGKTVVINSRLHMHIFYTQNQLINVLSRNYLCWNYPVPNVPISRYEDYSWRPLWLPSRPRLFSCKKTAGPELFSSIYLLNGGNRLSTSGRRTSAPREVSEFCAKLWKCRLESPIGWEAHPTMESKNWSDGV